MIYLDNSATTRPYEEVLEAYIKVNREFYGNASSIHNFGGKAEKLLTQAREQIADLVSAKPSEIIFTSGGTEGNNLAIKGTAMMHRGRGNHIITTAVEHPSVKETCKQLEEMGFEITYLPVNSNGEVTLEDVKLALTDRTILVSVMHVNNEVGTIQPIKEIGRFLHSYSKVLYHVDHIQGVGKVSINLYESHIDLCTFSAHKFHGLKGSGFLFKKQGVQLASLLTGGNQEQKLRSGTENTGGIVAMARALRMAESDRIENSERLLHIRNHLMLQLRALPDVVIHTPVHAAPHIICFSCVGQKGEVMVHALEEERIIVSTTSACSSKEKTPSSTLHAMGVEDGLAQGAIRVSLSYENTLEEVEIFIQALDQILQRLNRVMRRNQ